MKAIRDGGHAFPTLFIEPAHGSGYAGMTLRDWFAGQALNGLVVSHGYQGVQEELSVEGAVGSALLPSLEGGVAQEIAESAYGIADAMLAARKGGAS